MKEPRRSASRAQAERAARLNLLICTSRCGGTRCPSTCQSTALACADDLAPGSWATRRMDGGGSAFFTGLAALWRHSPSHPTHFICISGPWVDEICPTPPGTRLIGSIISSAEAHRADTIERSHRSRCSHTRPGYSRRPCRANGRLGQERSA